MQDENNAPGVRNPPAEPPETTQPPWQFEVGQLLTQAAILCVQHGLDLDTYMSTAWAAYVESRPGMRNQLEELHLLDQLEELRRAGRIGKA